MMRTYLIKITMPDGSRSEYKGVFSDGFAAVMQVMADFPMAKRISAVCTQASKEKANA
jgi:hypothetical protein